VKVRYGSGRELVRFTLDIVSVQVVRGCTGGTVRGGGFILMCGKYIKLFLLLFELLNFCFYTTIGSVRPIYQLVRLV
jgi:hypothetical protein